MWLPRKSWPTSFAAGKVCMLGIMAAARCDLDEQNYVAHMYADKDRVRATRCMKEAGSGCFR